MDKILPKYQISLIKKVEDAIWEEYVSYKMVLAYIQKWHERVEEGDKSQWIFPIKYDTRQHIDLFSTLTSMNDELILDIATDLGIETPDFIPSIPTFKNELKSNYETASKTFEKAFKNVVSDPDLAIGLANSALESIIKEILKDDRITIEYNDKDTSSKLISKICKAFHIDVDNSCPTEIRTIASSLKNACKAIEDLRSDKTIVHGKTDTDYIVTDPLYAYFIINAVSTIGLFLLNFYKTKYPAIKKGLSIEDELPF